jgi:fatty acid desaturase
LAAWRRIGFMTDKIPINWYRCKVEKAVMSQLMRRSDAKAFRQILLQLLLFAATSTLAYLAFLNVHASDWPRTLPLLLLALFVHGTCSRFLFGIAGHELAHKTPFRTQAFNEFFLKLTSFLSWFDYVAYRVSHVKHHQATVHADQDGEVVLPQGLDWHGIKFIVMELTVHPLKLWEVIHSMACAALGDVRQNGFFRKEWMTRILPDANAELRREHRTWARTLVIGQLSMAVVFAATGHWFLIVVVNLGCHYCDWLQLLCAAPQHIGLCPNVSDFRLCVRTYTCGRFNAFLYWNMQYHLEHHMFPAVPFYNLPRLRQAIEHDLPPAPHGLWATWREILPIMKRQRADKNYQFVPQLPGHNGEQVDDRVLESEAAQKHP